MNLVTNLTVEDTFLISGRGVVVAGKLRSDENHGFKIGVSVKIFRPDETTIKSLVRGVENFHTVSGIVGVGLLLSETITKQDVPRGSKISILE